MDLSVPGVRSPVCMGITVWQVAHRQIWWEPRWRTEAQPRSRSLRTKALAVTAQVYLVRRQCVHVAGRHMDGWSLFEVGKADSWPLFHDSRVDAEDRPECGVWPDDRRMSSNEQFGGAR
jgi:hypothetical protein